MATNSHAVLVVRPKTRNRAAPRTRKWTSGSRISREGVLQVAAEDHRSRTRNLDLARERLADLLAEALHRDPPRKATKPTRASRKRRVDDKKKRGEIKQTRKKPRSDD